MTLKIILIIAFIVFTYFMLFVAPAIVTFNSVFTRKKGTPFWEMDMKKSYFAPFFEQMSASRDNLAAKNQREVFITSFDGLKLVATYFDNGYDNTVILIHGFNTVPLNNYSVIADVLTNNGYNVLMVDSRASGRSEGKRSTLGPIEQYDVLKWIDYTENELKQKNIFIYGTSMGCATVSYASDKIKSDKVKGLILDCGFSSPYEQMVYDSKARHVPWIQMMFFTRILGKLILKCDIKQSVRDSLKNCKIPAMFVHGTGDTTVLFKFGKANYESCAGEKYMVCAEGAEHTMTFISDENCKNKILEFIYTRTEG